MKSLDPFCSMISRENWWRVISENIFLVISINKLIFGSSLFNALYDFSNLTVYNSTQIQNAFLDVCDKLNVGIQWGDDVVLLARLLARVFTLVHFSFGFFYFLSVKVHLGIKFQMARGGISKNMSPAEISQSYVRLPFLSSLSPYLCFYECIG